MRIWKVLLGILVIGCNEIKYCELVPERPVVVIDFFRADTTAKVAKTVAFSIIYPEDSRFYITSIQDTIDDDTLQRVGVLLHPEQLDYTYLFETDSQSFQLKLYYSREAYIYYEDCDPAYRYLLDSVGSNAFDSVAVVNPALIKTANTNVEVYF